MSSENLNDIVELVMKGVERLPYPLRERVKKVLGDVATFMTFHSDSWLGSWLGSGLAIRQSHKGSSLLLTHNAASATSLPWLDLYVSNTLVHITT